MKGVTEAIEESQMESKPQPTEMIITLELAQRIANYLNSKPYGEVNSLIGGMQESKVQ